MDVKTYTTEWGGDTLKVEVGKIAQQTNGSCVVTYGNTSVLATAVMSKNEREGMSYFPLMVEYQEKMYAAGKIKGSRFIKREARPSDEAVLVARLIDRAIRPLFDQRVRRDIQVVLTVLSIDEKHDPDIPGMIGAAVALSISDIPWMGPIAGARVGKINGELVLNPTYPQLEESILDLYVAGDGEKTIMLEAGAHEIAESDVFEAIQFAQKNIVPMMKFIEDIKNDCGKEKMEVSVEESEELKEARAKLKDFVMKQTEEYLLSTDLQTKQLRKNTMYEIKDMAATFMQENGLEDFKSLTNEVVPMIEDRVSEYMLETGKRVDGRTPEQIRPLSMEVGLYPRVHGTGLFTRGQTQVLSTVTLGSPGDEQVLDNMETSGKKHYMHHYNFPPYSVGEASPFRGTSRRDIGHGALAEKALVPVLPEKEDFPYTIRVVSEVMSSNGSSSMASACGSTLSLLDAGVPLKKPVAGVAMGMVSNKEGKYRILTDLQDLEDSEGGMDFKITGTRDGITAIQLDTKTHGLTYDMVQDTLDQALRGRIELLDAMKQVIAQPRESVSEFAPRITKMQINPDKIRDVIGPGGKVINEIIDETGVAIDIEQDGLVYITAEDAESAKRAEDWIAGIVKEAQVGEVYEGEVVRIENFGAFVRLFGQTDGLVHISEISHERIPTVESVLKIGQKVNVKVMEIDEKGRVNLSMKALTPRPEGMAQERPQPRSHKPSGPRKPYSQK